MKNLPLLSLPLFIASISAQASAQNVAAAEALFNKGVDEMEAGDYKAGCAHLAESYKIDPAPGALFTLADCHEKAGNIATAVVRYDEYLRAYEALPAAQQAKQRAKGRDKTAAARKAALQPKVPMLTLTLPGSAPRGTRVTLDEIEMGSASLDVALPLDPGEHVATTQAPGGPISTSRLTIGRGERKKVELKVELSGGAISPPTPEDAKAPGEPDSKPPEEAPAGRGSSGRRAGTIAAWTVGAAGIAAGFVTGSLAFSKQGAIDEGCGEPVDGKVRCNSTGLEAAQGAQTMELASTIAFAVGGAGVAAGLVLLFTRPKESAGAAAHGWVSAGVTTVGGGGALGVVKGAW